jgi:23S rRNA pseudouridine2604 synthase
VDGKVLQARQEMLYYVMHKPVGVETSNVNSLTRELVNSNKRINESTNQRKSTVRELLPQHLQGKIYPVGRLDKDSSGLLLFTNDGVLAYRLTHPKFHHEKEYVVTTEEPITEGQLRKIQSGLIIDGERTKPVITGRISPNRFRISLTEGRNRQIRRMCQKVGTEVKLLERVRITTLHSLALKSGEVRELTISEKDSLLRSVGL